MEAAKDVARQLEIVVFARRSQAADPRPEANRPTVDALEDRLVPSGTGVISGSVLADLTGNGLSPDDTALAGIY